MQNQNDPREAGRGGHGNVLADIPKSTTSPIGSNSAAAQRKRFEDALRESPVSTTKARHELDILQPAARIFELRHGPEALNIQREWIEEENPGGGRHRVALYVLQPGTWEGAP